MRIHNPFVTGSLTVSGSKGVDFSDATVVYQVPLDPLT